MSQSGSGMMQQVRKWLGERPGDTILRSVFSAMLGVTAVVLAYDLMELHRTSQDEGWRRHVTPVAAPTPYLPSARPSVAPGGPRDQRLAEAMSFDLVADGRLLLTGTIQPGTAERFAKEISKRGDYVKTVVLHSPGGSVSDALAMGRLIRERGLATLVEADGYCASSCPLVFSGGIERHARPGATIGVHQVFTSLDLVSTAGEGMDRAQRISAECQRYLVDMGIDPRVWMHAMETPPNELFYFKDNELSELKLATDVI